MPEKARGLAQIYQRYLDTISLTRRPETVRSYKYTLSGFLRFVEKHHPRVCTCGDLRRDDIESWLRYLIGRKNRPLQTSTRRLWIILVRNFLQDISTWGWKGAPKSSLFRSGDLPPKDRQLPKPISPEADQLIQNELKKTNGFYEKHLLLLRATGMRVGEFLNLEMDALNKFPNNRWSLHVPIGKLHSERVIPLYPSTARLVNEIKLLRGEHPPIRHPDTGKLTDFLVIGPNGRRPWRYTLRRILQRAANRAGVKEPVTLHKLRHTFATEMVRAGMSLPALKEILGHRTIAMTLRYVQVTQMDIQREYLSTMESIKARYKIPDLPRRSKSTEELTPSPPNILSLLKTAAMLMESFRRDCKNKTLQKRTQRLIERLKRFSNDLENLAS